MTVSFEAQLRHLLKAAEIEFARVKYGGGDGSSPKTAVLIHGTENHFCAIYAQRQYLNQIFGNEFVDWQLLSQSLITESGNFYDCLIVLLANRSERTYYFDMSKFIRRVSMNKSSE